MAVDDFRLSVGFFTHPKIKELERRRRAGGVLALIKLYAFAALHYTDGVLPGFTKRALASHIGRGSHFEKLIDDLVALKLLDEIEGGFKIHDWEAHQGWVANASKRSRRASANASVGLDRPTRKQAKTSAGLAEDRAEEPGSRPVLGHSSGANSAETKEPADAPIPTFPYPSSPSASTRKESQEVLRGEAHDDRWREAVEWFLSVVPKRCAPSDRPFWLKRLVDRLRGDGFNLQDLPSSAGDDIISGFVPKITAKSKPVANMVLQEWQQALALNGTEEASDERASADDFVQELKRDPSLLVRRDRAVMARGVV